MAVPRPVLLALLGVALCAAAFLATRGAHDPGSASVTAIPAPPTPAPTHAAKPAAKKPVAHKAATHKAAAPKAVAHKPAPKHAAAATPAGPLASIQDVAHAATPAKPEATKPAAKPQTAASTAERVRSALAQGQVVVFFFTRAGAADDTGTRGAVQALHGVKHVLVVKAGLEDLTTFRPVLSGAGVTQVPSVVVVHKGKKARLIEGYVDRGTLRQSIADARR